MSDYNFIATIQKAAIGDCLKWNRISIIVINRRTLIDLRPDQATINYDAELMNIPITGHPFVMNLIIRS